MKEVQQKLRRLKRILAEMRSVLIAYSGGVDSTFLLKVAVDILKDKVVAVTAVSETYPEGEYREARKLARFVGVKHLTVETSELKDRKFTRNQPDRCYFCKKELFAGLQKIARAQRLDWVADGANLDDARDFRPGSRAAGELGVRSPLQEAKLTKKDIRLLSRKMKLPTWNRPSLACLASRFPYGRAITSGELKKIAEAEKFFRKAGFRQIRVRHHGRTCRIELEPGDLGRLIEKKLRIKVVKKLKSLGFTYICLDLEGYRPGSMNEVL